MDAEYSDSNIENDECSHVANFTIYLSCFEDPFLQAYSNPLLQEITFYPYLDYGISSVEVQLFRKRNYGMFSWYLYAFGLVDDPLMFRELMNCVT